MVLLRLPTHSQDDDGDASDRLVSINIVFGVHSRVDMCMM